MIDYTICNMMEAQIPAAAALERVCFSQPWSEESFRAEREKEGAVLLAAVENGELIGWAGLESVLGEGSVTNIAVDPEHRGKGIGEALTAALIERSALLGLETLTLEVRVSNHAAIALYRKLGFLELGVRPRFYDAPREDALMMQIALTSKEEKL